MGNRLLFNVHGVQKKNVPTTTAVDNEIIIKYTTTAQTRRLSGVGLYYCVKY